jgi:hypothetical protein
MGLFEHVLGGCPSHFVYSILQFCRVFTGNKLAERVMYSQKRGFELTSVDVHQAVFQHAGGSNPFSEKTKISSKHWVTIRVYEFRNDVLGHEQLGATKLAAQKFCDHVK